MQDAEQPLVVVMADLSIERRNDGQMFAAHLDDLGLTAYGRTVEEARKELIGVFNVWVNFYRERGLLEERLNQMGAEWTWLHTYEGDIPVEYTSSAVMPVGSASEEEVSHYQPFHGRSAVAA